MFKLFKTIWLRSAILIQRYEIRYVYILDEIILYTRNLALRTNKKSTSTSLLNRINGKGVRKMFHSCYYTLILSK